MEQRKIIGYKVIKTYPDSHVIGVILMSKTSFDRYSKYPEFLEPVYEEEKLEIIEWDNVVELNNSWIEFKGKLTQEHINKIKEVI